MLFIYFSCIWGVEALLKLKMGLPVATRLVISGGADRGVISAAAITAVSRKGMNIGSLFATSVGLLNSWAFILGITDELEQIWKKEVKVKSKLQKLNLKGLAKGLIRNSPSLFEDEFINDLVNRYVTPGSYQKAIESPIDFEFPILNLNEGKIEIISKGAGIPFAQFKKCMLAAVSVPGLYPSVEIDSIWYSDAGFIDNVGLFLALRHASPDDTVIILHNYPRETTALPWKYSSWLKALWRSTELKQTVNAAKDTNIYGEFLNKRNDFLKRIEEIIPAGSVFRRNKLRKIVISEFNKIFGSLAVFNGSKVPLVEKKIDIFPPSHLALFKTSTPSQKELREAFDEMLIFTEEFLKQEFPAE